MKNKTKKKLYVGALVITSLISAGSLTSLASKAWSGHENMVVIQQDINTLKQRVLDRNAKLNVANSKIDQLTSQLNSTSDQINVLGNTINQLKDQLNQADSVNQQLQGQIKND